MVNGMMELCTALRQVRLLSYLHFVNGFLFAVIAVTSPVSDTTSLKNTLKN